MTHLILLKIIVLMSHKLASACFSSKKDKLLQLSHWYIWHLLYIMEFWILLGILHAQVYPQRKEGMMEPITDNISFRALWCIWLFYSRGLTCDDYWFYESFFSWPEFKFYRLWCSKWEQPRSIKWRQCVECWACHQWSSHSFPASWPPQWIFERWN